MWVYIVIAVIFIYAVYKERQALGCPNVPNGVDCDNANGKAVKGSNVNPNMSTPDILTTVSYAAHFEDRWVKWRIFFMLSVCFAVVAAYIMQGKFVDERDLLIYVTVLMLALVLTSNFYKFHLTDFVAKNITSAVNILKTRV